MKRMVMNRWLRPVLALVAAAAVSGAGCGGSGSELPPDAGTPDMPDGGMPDAGTPDTPGMAPTVTASANHTSGVSGTVVQFNASGTAMRGNSIANYVWTFDDGDFAYGATPTKTFYALGTYTVHLSVIDNLGNVTTTTLTITISGGTGSAVVMAAAEATPVPNSTTSAAPAPVADLVQIPRAAPTTDGFHLAAPANWSAGGSNPVQQPVGLSAPNAGQFSFANTPPAQTFAPSTQPANWLANLVTDLEPELAII